LIRLAVPSRTIATLDGQALHNLQADLVKTDGPTLDGSWANDQCVEVGKERKAPVSGS
jgi:hypothetical protein